MILFKYVSTRLDTWVHLFGAQEKVMIKKVLDEINFIVLSRFILRVSCRFSCHRLIVVEELVPVGV